MWPSCLHTGGLNYVSYTFMSIFDLWRGKKGKKKEWVGNSLKTIVLTAAKDLAPCYCSQCCHITLKANVHAQIPVYG